MIESFPWSKIITMIISTVALILSGWSLYFAHQSNVVSKEANGLAEKSIETSNRPWIVVDFKKQKNENYYVIKKDEELGRVSFNYSIKIKNIGKTPASNISIPNILKVEDLKQINENFEIKIPSGFILFPDQEYVYDFEFSAIPADMTLEKKYSELAGKDISSIFTFIINYENFNDTSKQYKTKKIFEISKTMVSYLDGDEVK